VIADAGLKEIEDMDYVEEISELNNEQNVGSGSRMFRKIFPSHSHKDLEIVYALEEAYRALTWNM
jgi:hypothetical protein